MPKVVDAKRVKSAGRVLELLEYFTAERQEATVMEVAREFGYPQSSTSELLSCLVELGFLKRDRSARSYRPTARVAMLGAWVHPALMRHGHLLKMMDDLAEGAGCRVVLGGAVGLGLQHFHVVGATPADDLDDPVADACPGLLPHSAMGRLLLSIYDRSHIRKLVHRLNAEAAAPESRLSCDALLAEVDQIRRLGFSATASLGEGGGGVCAVLLPQAAAEEPLALGLMIAKGDHLGCDHHVRALRNALASHLGPVLAHRQPDFGLQARHAY